MKSKDLIKILEKHPELTVVVSDLQDRIPLTYAKFEKDCEYTEDGFSTIREDVILIM